MKAASLEVAVGGLGRLRARRLPARPGHPYHRRLPVRCSDSPDRRPPGVPPRQTLGNAEHRASHLI